MLKRDSPHTDQRNTLKIIEILLMQEIPQQLLGCISRLFTGFYTQEVQDFLHRQYHVYTMCLFFSGWFSRFSRENERVSSQITHSMDSMHRGVCQEHHASYIHLRFTPLKSIFRQKTCWPSWINKGTPLKTNEYHLKKLMVGSVEFSFPNGPFLGGDEFVHFQGGYLLKSAARLPLISEERLVGG